MWIRYQFAHSVQSDLDLHGVKEILFNSKEGVRGLS